jgi:sorting and assembly machinery component 37
MHRFSSLVESHGQPLLDLSLYVSSENYSKVTRPIYSQIQSFPLPYLTPGTIRAAAKKRTEHLGLSSLDIDTEEHAPSPSIIPTSLLHPRQTVSSLLAASPEANASIRLNALAKNFFEPLQELRGEKRYFVSNKEFSSLDCLVLGYLSLMLLPELPQSWLADAMRKDFPALCGWTEALSTSVFGPETTISDAFPRILGDSPEDLKEKRTREKGILPWTAPSNGGVIGVGSTFLASVADSIPVVGQLRRNTRMRQHGGKTQEEESSSWQTLTTIGSFVAGVGIMIGYALHSGLITLPSAETEQKSGGLRDFGEAGAALGLYSSQMSKNRTAISDESITTAEVPIAEIDMEV